MNKLIRFYNQNRFFVILSVIIIALIVIVIHVLNDVLKKSEDIKKQQILNNTTNAVIQNMMDKEDVSPITGEKVQNNEVYTSIIKQFVEYCNNKQYEEAYDMLTEDCKSQLYPTVESFAKNYVDRIFYIYRMYSLENWYDRNIGKTYYIKYTEDVLATGSIKSSDNKSDYITVTNDTYSNCLNINSFIACVEENKSQTKNDVTITVNKKYMYMDYTILNLQIKNDRDETICLDEKKEFENVYLYDIEQVKYQALLNENSAEELEVYHGTTNEINIKFNKRYSPDSRTLKGLIFKKVILNYENYVSNHERIKSTNFDIDIYV